MVCQLLAEVKDLMLELVRFPGIVLAVWTVFEGAGEADFAALRVNTQLSSQTHL